MRITELLIHNPHVVFQNWSSSHINSPQGGVPVTVEIIFITTEAVEVKISQFKDSEWVKLKKKKLDPTVPIT